MTRFFQTSLTIYRHTLKRFLPIHLALHWLMTRTFIPLLERARRFYTMKDDPFWFRLELLTNRHEAETVRHFEGHLKAGMVMLDVGAHVGYYTRRGAMLVGKNGRIIAFEPHPRTFKTLERNTAHFPQVSRAQLAVAESEGSAELFDYLVMSASGSLHYDESMVEQQKASLHKSDIAPRVATDFPVEKFTVRTVAIDDYLAELGIEQVDAVKMDIEGAEIGALRGMKKTIARSPHLMLIMEYNPTALKGFGFDPQAALHEVLQLGFTRMYAIEADGRLTDLTHDNTALAARTQSLLETMGVVNMRFTRE